MRTRIFGALLLGVLSTPPAAIAHAGDLRWEDQSGVEFTGVSVAGNDVVVAGIGGDLINPNFLVRAYDSRSGALLWQDEFDQAGGRDLALAIAQTGDGVFAVGSTSPDMQYTTPRFFVRAYESKTGHLLWEETFDDGNRSIATNVVAAGHRVFVAGFSESEQVDFDSMVRAYDADTGVLIWQDRIEQSGGPGLNGVNALALATEGNRVFAAGVAKSPRGDGDFLIHAYDATTGDLLWSDEVDGAGLFDAASDVTVSQGRVSVVGSVAVGKYFFTVRTYSAHDGTLLWQDRFAASGGTADAFSVASVGGKVFATGAAFRTIPGGPEFLIRAYDSGTGSLLWEDHFDGGGFAFAFRVTAEGNRVFAVGSVGPSAYQDFLVRAYDSRTGHLDWQDRLDTGGGAQASDVAAAGGYVFAAGMGGEFGVSYAGCLRSYAAR